MGVSTDGQLSYGVVFEEGFDFPWDGQEFEGDEEEWWKAVNGYTNPNPCPYTDAGEYKPGMNLDSPEVGPYHDHSSAWLKNHPFPVQIVNYCSADYGVYLLAVKHFSCNRGYPVEIKRSFLDVADEDRKKLRGFLEKYGIEADEPKWWLTSYWG